MLSYTYQVPKPVLRSALSLADPVGEELLATILLNPQVTRLADCLAPDELSLAVQDDGTGVEYSWAGGVEDDVVATAAGVLLHEVECRGGVSKRLVRACGHAAMTARVEPSGQRVPFRGQHDPSEAEDQEEGEGEAGSRPKARWRSNTAPGARVPVDAVGCVHGGHARQRPTMTRSRVRRPGARTRHIEPRRKPQRRAEARGQARA